MVPLAPVRVVRLYAALSSWAIFQSGLALMLAPVSALADAPKPSSCAGNPSAPELNDARARLERDPTALTARFRLSDALIEEGCFQEAVRVLEAGQDAHAHSAELQTRLRNARSMLNEQQYFDRLGHAEEAAKMQRNVLRCTKLGDLEACDSALVSKPNDRDILTAKGDALLQAGRPAEALPVYRRAGQGNPGNDTIENKIAAAESLRRSFVARCQNDRGEAALEACRHALLHGTEDELAINKRVRTLQSIDQPTPPSVAAPRKVKPPARAYSNQALAGRTN